jgi:hypothetical protein
MRKLAQVIVLTLAINFLVAAGAVGWLWYGGHLDRTKLQAIGQVLFPPPAPPATQPAAAPATRPAIALEELLAQHAGRPASEQLRHIRASFDARMIELEQARTELLALKDQVARAQAQLAADRADLEQRRSDFDRRTAEAQRLAADKGFQDALAIYTTLPAEAVKTHFMTMDEDTIVQFLRAMEPRMSARIIREFKSKDELALMARVLQKMREPQAAAKE